MSVIFEILDKDAGGRIGKLRTPHGTVETPTVMPVINPNIQLISPKEMKSFGAEILITNSYIIYRKEELRNVALEKGLHGLLDFDGPIMTDSGSFQLSVYGSVEVTNEEILEFQKKIGSDIIVPLIFLRHRMFISKGLLKNSKSQSNVWKLPESSFKVNNSLQGRSRAQPIST